MRRFRWMTCLAAGLSAFAAGAAPAAAADLSVPMDEVRVVTFATPIATVFVGNPLIADVTVIDATRVFVLGKNFGTTNLVALDAAGRQIVNDRITVLGRTGGVVTLQRGRAQTTLACAGSRCQTAPVPGDDVAPFDAVTEQINAREEGLRAAAGEDAAQ